MEDIDIPEANKETVSTRIDSIAHDILKKLSVTKYGSESHMSSVLTDAVRFVHDPTPTQRVAQEKFLNNIDVYPRDPDCSDSKVIHWTAPSELVAEMRSLGTSNREFIESAIYEYESAYDTMSDEFSVESVSSEQVIDWDVMEDNYSVNQTTSDVKGADVPSKPSKRRPFIYSLMDEENGVKDFDKFSLIYYDMLIEQDDVSGLPQEGTRRKDWQALIDQKYLIPMPSVKADRPIETVDSDYENYYPRRVLEQDDNPIETAVEDYLQDMEAWINMKAEKGITYETTDSVFQQRENTLSVIVNYEIQELQEYAERADELQNKMVKELVEMPA